MKGINSEAGKYNSHIIFSADIKLSYGPECGKVGPWMEYKQITVELRGLLTIPFLTIFRPGGSVSGLTKLQLSLPGSHMNRF
jgi:hypothetical protein